MAGCRLVNDEKSWFTTYTRSRWFLFLTLVLLLALPANAFLEIAAAGEFPLGTVIARSVYVFALLWAIYRVALGHFVWSIAVFAILAMRLNNAIPSLERQPELAQFAIGMFAVLGLCLAITIFVYRHRVRGPI